MDVSISTEGLDPEWDRFLETLPDNLYQQSSLWAKVKEMDGWKQLRLVVKEQSKIVGGVQMLLRPVPIYGMVGYVSKGPVIASDNRVIQEFVLDQMQHAARKEHIVFLKVQPAQWAGNVTRRLVERGALLSTIPVTPLATLRVDLRLASEDILTHMDKSPRRNIRRAERKGMTVRLGTEADISTFNHLQKIHAGQRGYNPDSEDYTYNLWSTLAPGGHFCLLLAEYEGEVLAARSCIAFGDTVLAYHLVDNGVHRELNAHTLLQWKGMLWSKEHGYTWYDFGGISVETATAIMNGEPMPDNTTGRRAQFKRSLGGELMLRPGVYDVSYLWPDRLTIRLVPLMLKMKPLLDFAIGEGLGAYVHRRARSTRGTAPSLGQEVGSSRQS